MLRDASGPDADLSVAGCRTEHLMPRLLLSRPQAEGPTPSPTPRASLLSAADDRTRTHKLVVNPLTSTSSAIWKPIPAANNVYGHPAYRDIQRELIARSTAPRRVKTTSSLAVRKISRWRPVTTCGPVGSPGALGEHADRAGTYSAQRLVR